MKNDLGVKADDKEAMKANLAAQVCLLPINYVLI